jgi:hypothetical protein
MNAKGILIATAAATLFLAGAVPARAAEQEGGDKVNCMGINSCKGTGSCASAENACAGKNACKGHGVTKATAAECQQKGGKVVPEQKKH